MNILISDGRVQISEFRFQIYEIGKGGFRSLVCCSRSARKLKRVYLFYEKASQFPDSLKSVMGDTRI